MSDEQIKVMATRRAISEMGAYNSDSGGCPLLHSDVVSADLADDLLRALVETKKYLGALSVMTENDALRLHELTIAAITAATRKD